MTIIQNIPINQGWFAVLWSPHQDGFHIETFEEMFQTNVRIFLERNLGDYILMSVAKTHDEAAEHVRLLRESRENADTVRSESAVPE